MFSRSHRDMKKKEINKPFIVLSPTQMKWKELVDAFTGMGVRVIKNKYLGKFGGWREDKDIKCGKFILKGIKNKCSK